MTSNACQLVGVNHFNYLVTSTMSIELEAANLCKKIKKLRYQLGSFIPLSASKIEAKEEAIKD